jgi:hypothetical protein
MSGSHLAPRPAAAEPVVFSFGLTIGIVGVLFAVRVFLSAYLGLTPDEAYYWLWSRFPDWSYFDHPPLTAWLIWGSTALLGPTPLAVRLPAHVCLGLALLLVAAAGRDLAGRNQAGWAAALRFSDHPGRAPDPGLGPGPVRLGTPGRHRPRPVVAADRAGRGPRLPG